MSILRPVFGALQGALLVKRTTGDAYQLKTLSLISSRNCQALTIRFDLIDGRSVTLRD
jgi:hypothetical protein